MLRGAVRKLPLEFRVLYRQFLLRAVDLEALSVEADVLRLLGQFAGVLFLISVFESIGLFFASESPSLRHAGMLVLGLRSLHGFLSGTMLVAGLFAVISWDNIFPDRRDVMVLGPLPVRPLTILLAKVVACGVVLAVGVVALNCAMGVALPLVAGGIAGFPRMVAAYWTAAVGGAVFVYGSVLTVQGLLAWMLPRRWFLRVSSFLQMAAFAYFLANYFLEPTLWSPGWANAVTLEGQLRWWPSYWFLALADQMGGLFRGPFVGMARWAWVGLSVAVSGAAAALLLCYVRTMKKTVEEPDLVPGRRGWKGSLRFGDKLTTAVVLFSGRSLARSKQHRVVYAFFLSVAFAIAVSMVKGIVESGARRPLTPSFLMATFVMMCVAVVGLRSIFSLPVSLKANWVLQVTQLWPSVAYIAATRRSLLLLAALPVWLVAAGLGFGFRPWMQVAAHLVVLGLVGLILTDLSLIGVSKVPFACSYLPGKSNIQYMFWAFVVVFVPIAMEFADYEQRALGHVWRYALLVAALGGVDWGLWAFNLRKARTAVLYYEELEPVVIQTLGLAGARLGAPIEFEPRG
jgi:hypothetical protein